MSKLDELIAEYCPDGVEYVALGEIGSFYGGLSGKSKEDFIDGNAKFITYMNVYSNIAINTDIHDLVRVGVNEKQNTVQYGDVLFTGSSETPDECGISSVLTTKIEEKIYLNSFCFGFRLKNENLLLPDFSKYLFRSEEVRKQINRTASGVTRFNVSKKKMEKVVIPLPPLPVQEEIVRILDNFTELTVELTEQLTKELTARKKQYEYYRDKLLTFGDEVPVVKLGEIGTIIRGSGLKKSDFTENGVKCIHYGEIYTYYGTFTSDTKSFVSPELAAKLKKVSTGDIIITVTSENIEDVCKCVVWLGEDDIVTGGHTAILKHNQNPKYIAYYLQTSSFFDHKCKIAHGTKVIEVSPKKLEQIPIPIPPLSEQDRIVSILDRFDALCNDLTSGLSAEIEARQKQYEYYRDKLLTFPARPKGVKDANEVKT